jgi:alpha-ketoglutarate-dependent taurine dioxygenase
MAQSFWLSLVSILMVVLLWILPSLDQAAAALELPEELQDLLNQAATDLNFPYPTAKEADSADEAPDEVQAPSLERRISIKAPMIEAPSVPSEAQKGMSSVQHPN